MTVELIPNPDNYDELYPEESEESEDEASESEDESEPETDKERHEATSAKIEELQRELKLSSDAMAASRSRLLLLESLMGKIEKPDAEVITSSVEQYRVERKKIYEEQAELEIATTKATEEIEAIKLKQEKLDRPTLKAKEKARKEKEKIKQKAREKKWKEKKEKQKAKAKLYEERSRFWPKKVYKVVLSLDANSGFTPASSRRGSIDSLAKTPATPTKQVATQSSTSSSTNSCQVSLCLQYVTSSASWVPHYDLIINSPSSSGTIVYRADFYNTTSETWKDSKVILSTSQTSFQGLGEEIPFMHPWYIRLQKGSRGDNDIIYSALEKKSRAEQKNKAISKGGEQNRAWLFGLDGKIVPGFERFQDAHTIMPQSMLQAPQRPQGMLQALQQPQTVSLFGSSRNDQVTGGLFGSSSANVGAAAHAGLRFGAVNQQQQQSVPPPPMPSTAAPGEQARLSRKVYGDPDFDAEYDSDGDDEGRTIVPTEAALAFQESAWEESGLTATYEVPGLRTIAPSLTARRHRITTVDLKDISLSYTCVPKLRTAAFLKAAIKNTSHFTLLKGLAGLTLDGSFLGNTYLKRVSAGESLKLPLGVDPAIHVSYARPGVRKNLGSGFINKEDSWVYTRSCTLTNSKTTGSPAYIMVIDQVPVSEDERLKVDILAPRGLDKEGDKVKAGEAITVASLDSGKSSTRASTYSLDSVRGKVDGGKKTNESWGRAVATIKKAGEVGWEVWLEPGKTVRLVLEYETRFPASESVVSA